MSAFMNFDQNRISAFAALAILALLFARRRSVRYRRQPLKSAEILDKYPSMLWFGVFLNL